MRAKDETVANYLNNVSDTRRSDLEGMRDLIHEHIPEGYHEVMDWGMISYQAPKNLAGGTQNKPLVYVSLAAQKNYNSLYLCGLNCIPNAISTFKETWLKSGKSLQMKAGCLRFKKLSDLALEPITQLLSTATPEEFVAFAKAHHGTKEKKYG